MAKITTHVLDISVGKPAAGVAVRLERDDGTLIGRGVTDDDGRLRTLSDPDGVPAGMYRISFDTGAYYAKRAQECFYPQAQITFIVKDASQHFHVPLLVAPYGFSTYRGS